MVHRARGPPPPGQRVRRDQLGHPDLTPDPAPTSPPAVVDDQRRVSELLGRAPRASFDVMVRSAAGRPVVIRNAPLLDDGTPMPTRFWLVGLEERRAVGRLESTGGVRAAERAVDPAALGAAHRRYAAERDAALPPGYRGPRPSGGVGGTRRGVKCLHAHYAWHLAGGDDPVGRWVATALATRAAALAAGPGEGPAAGPGPI